MILDTQFPWIKRYDKMKDMHTYNSDLKLFEVQLCYSEVIGGWLLAKWKCLLSGIVIVKLAYPKGMIGVMF